MCWRISHRFSPGGSISLLFAMAAGAFGAAPSLSAHPSPYAKWSRGPSSDPAFFPLGVWLQDPANAPRYRQAGFNTYVGLWQGSTEAQLAGLKQAGMRVICKQNEVGLRHLDDPTIIGWMHGDEPDNAQSLGTGLGWGPPVPPEKIVRDYLRLQSADPSRPVMLNLGQGVAWDGWYGRGPRSNHPEDYPPYLKGCDIASFDIYPVVHDRPEVANKLWLVAQGVERLVRWGGAGKVVWNCLECTRINNPTRKPTPHQIRAEAWMSLIHGSRGLIFFVHQFKPTFREPALLDDAEMLGAVTALNRQITTLAPVLNSATLQEPGVRSQESTVPGVDIPALAPKGDDSGSKSGPTGESGARPVPVAADNPAVPVAIMVKRHEGLTYVFAVAMRDGDTTATFTVKGIVGNKTIEVLDEKRTLSVENGSFKDHFGPWDVHLYRLPP